MICLVARFDSAKPLITAEGLSVADVAEQFGLELRTGKAYTDLSVFARPNEPTKSFWITELDNRRDIEEYRSLPRANSWEGLEATLQDESSNEEDHALVKAMPLTTTAA